MSALVYLKAVGIYWYAVAGIILGLAAFLPYIPGWGRRLEEGAVTFLRRLAVLLAVLILFVAQYLAWQDMDRQRADVERERANLEQQLTAERERVARLESRRDALENELTSERITAAEATGRLEGRAEAAEVYREEERGRAQDLQVQLHAAQTAARDQIAADAWVAEDDVRLVGGRPAPKQGGLEGLDLILQTTRDRRPYGLIIECDCVIADAGFMPGSRFTGAVSANKLIREDGRAVRLTLYDPPFTPYESLLARIYSKERVIVTKVESVPLSQIP